MLTRKLRFARNGAVRLAFVERGHDGHPLLFVPGYMARRQIWALQVAHFSRFRRLLVYDRRGNGDSDRPASEEAGRDYALERQVDDLVAVADAAGWDRFDLVGHSMGGFIAMAFAVHHPQRVRRLALLATAPYRTTEADFGVGVFLTEGGEPTRWDEDGVRRAVDLLVPEPGASWLRMEMRRTIPESVDPQQARQTFAVFDGVDLRPDLHRLSAPTLVLHGTVDRVVPIEEGQRLGAAIREATFVPLEGLGHMLMVTGAREVNQRLEAFLGREPR